jgi:hypothetical protein
MGFARYPARRPIHDRIRRIEGLPIKIPLGSVLYGMGLFFYINNMKLTIQSIEYKIIDVDKSIKGSIFDNVYWFHLRCIYDGKESYGTIEIGDTVTIGDERVWMDSKFTLEAFRSRIETELTLEALPAENR